MRNIKRVIEEHITRNIRTYFILIIIFLLGLIIGLIVVNNSSEGQETEMANYINNFITFFNICLYILLNFVNLLFLKTSFIQKLVFVLAAVNVDTPF